jgi:5-oxoprolinase (ATP-hydrolysing) subunit C
MNGVLEVVQPGIGTTVQDGGRRGHRHQGVPVAGWLDGPLAQAANALLANATDAAVLELRGMGTVLRAVAGPVRVALAGRISATVEHSDGTQRLLAAWTSATLQPGDALQPGAAESGCAYLAVSGGLRVEPQLGSRSSDWRAGLGGVLGRTFRQGDELPCGTVPATDVLEWRSRSPWVQAESPLRVIPGPQQDHFTPAAVAQFFAEEWTATAAQDRMGLRLSGAALAHTSAAAADIVSDGVTPGAIQVPANGQPIVLLADGQTVGGYPKIATVISADLPRLAHLRPGTRVRFETVSHEQALQALQDERARWQHWLSTRETFLPAGSVDEEALYKTNLISGMCYDR